MVRGTRNPGASQAQRRYRGDPPRRSRGGVGSSREHPWAAGIVSLYNRFLGALEPALGDLGSRAERLVEPRRGSRVRSPICFEDQLADTLVVDGRKAVGCSQARRKGGVLIHAAILLGLDAELYSKVFGVDAERVHGGLAAAVSGLGWEEVADAILGRLAGELGAGIAASRRPDPPIELLARYHEPRWAPVLDGGIQ